MKEEKNLKHGEHRTPVGRADYDADAIPGINTPGIELPAFNPPIPNRAWTAMRKGIEEDTLTDAEKQHLDYGSDEAL